MTLTVEQRFEQRLRFLEENAAIPREGEITGTSPIEVAIGGSANSVEAFALDGIEYEIGDRVSVFTFRGDLIVCRPVANPTGGGGDPIEYTSGPGISIIGDEIAADFGTGDDEVAEGNDSRFPTTGEKAALAGTSGTPGSGNKYVTDQDARNSNQRTPSDGSVTAAKVAGSLKPSSSAAATDESLRRLGTGSTHAAAGDDSRFPTAGQKNALSGTAGTPGSGNPYATKQTTDLLAPKADPTFTGSVVIPDADADNEAASLGQVEDGVALAQRGFRIKTPCRFVVTTPLAAHSRSGDTLTSTAQGVFPNSVGTGFLGAAVGDRVLIAGEGGGSHLENGIYEIVQLGILGSQNWVITRTADATAGTLESGAWVPIIYPTGYLALGVSNPAPYYLATSDPITVNTTALQWVSSQTTMEGTQKDCGADLTVGTSASDVNNLTYTVVVSGTYLVTFNLDVNCTTAAGAFIGSINVNGSDVRSAVFSASAINNRTTVSLTRRVSVSAGQIIKVRAIRVAGGYTIEADNSSMTVQRVA